MPDRAEPHPRPSARTAAGAPSAFKPIALPALKAALDAKAATEKAPRTATKPCADELERFGRSYTA